MRRLLLGLVISVGFHVDVHPPRGIIDVLIRLVNIRFEVSACSVRSNGLVRNLHVAAYIFIVKVPFFEIHLLTCDLLALPQIVIVGRVVDEAALAPTEILVADQRAVFLQEVFITFYSVKEVLSVGSGSLDVLFLSFRVMVFLTNKAGPNLDVPRFGGEFNSVSYQIDEHLCQPWLVHVDHLGHVARHLEANADLLLFGLP